VAGGRGRRVLVLDHNEKAGAKILISGGGRCNFTNRFVAADRYLSANPHFAKSALKRYTQNDFIELVNRHRIAFHERELGQLFCDETSAHIVNMLMAECGAGGVDFRFGAKVADVEGDGPYGVVTEAGTISAANVVVATGGLSIPKIGATGFAHHLARRRDLAVTELRPALVPLTFTAADLDFMRDLTGIAVDAVVSHGKTRFREAVLFTHRGLSGPAILQISSYWREGGDVAVNLCPDTDVAGWLVERKASRPKAEAKTVLAELLPARLAEGMAERAGVAGARLADLPNKALAELGRLVNSWTLRPAGTEGYRTAEVTLGGVSTGDLSSKTMAARAHPGLFFVGEAVDVTGWLGGYNFQWAWSSGWVAGQSV
jgi:predicted Rossmann fold flavoprotein